MPKLSESDPERTSEILQMTPNNVALMGMKSLVLAERSRSQFDAALATAYFSLADLMMHRAIIPPDFVPSD